MDRDPPSDTSLGAVIFDWAGTTLDFGSVAPVVVFHKIFEREGLPVTAAEARAPMGQAKRDHIAAMLRQPRIRQAWTERHGSPPSDADVDRLYRDFLPLQLSVLKQHCDLIPGLLDTIAECRRRGLRIGGTTGYTRELMAVVEPEAARQGYTPDVSVCSDEVTAARPAPWMLLRAAEQLNVYPLWRVVKVDDTPAGIAEGRNAGAWTVGVTDTGNELGLTYEEYVRLDAGELTHRRAAATERLRATGAHFVIPGVADLVTALDMINERLARGERPI